MIKKVKVGPQVYEIIQRSINEDGTLNDGAHGYTLDSGNIIVVDSAINKTKKQVTILHEILHAIRMNNDGMPKPGKEDDFEAWEHYFIALYENNLLVVLQDNPKLVEWLTKNGN